MLIQLSGRIWYNEGEQETDRPYLYYIRGDEKSAVIDAGNSERHVKSFYQALEEKGFPLPEITVLTHWHWDHTFGMAYVHGKTIASEPTDQKLREVMRWEWTPEKMREREKSGEDIAFCNECIRKEYPDLSKIKVVPAGKNVLVPEEIPLGGVTLRLIPGDSPHTRDALYIFIPEERALGVGDAFCGDYYDGGGECDPEKVRAMLVLWETMPFDTVLPGHSPPCPREELVDWLTEEMGLEEK